jgi:signal transduction histidine kinase
MPGAMRCFLKHGRRANPGHLLFESAMLQPEQSALLFARMRSAVFQCLWVMLAVALCDDGARAAEVVRTAGALRGLSPAEAKKALPVEMEVIVTFVDRSRGMLFVHDGANGFFVKAHELVGRSAWLTVGRKLRLLGLTHEGEFLPVVNATELIDLGTGVMPPAPFQNPLEAMLTPSMDSQWVEVEGVVKRVADENEGVTLCLQAGELRLPLELPRNANFETLAKLPVHLLERRVRLRVVAATQFNEQRQMSGRMLYLPGLDFLTLVETAGVAAAVPLRRVDELLLSSSPLHERVRVRGVVTHALPEQMLFIRGEGGSMRIDSALTPAFKPGTLIEAEGNVIFFPFRPGLNAATLTMLEESASPEPLPLDHGADRRSGEQFELVSVDTTYLDMMQASNGTRLLCRSEGVVFEAKLPPDLHHEFRLEPGMRLRLRGICELELDNPFGIARFTKVFTITLRSAQDLVVLRTPPYWNNKRLLWLLLVTGGAGLLIAAWAWMLRRKVAEQSGIIERQTAARATLEERQRISRELHDTLEQELSGVAILLDTTSQQIETGDGEPSRSLNLARQLLRHSREESRTTIRDLRSVAIEQMGLVGAMEAMLRPLAESAGMAFDFATCGGEILLPGTVEATFLRIAHEAVANSAKHSGGSRVKVRMEYGPAEVTLEVGDDGAGFSPETAANDSTGHFGLMGMRERALRIGAVLRVDGRSEYGTRVSLTWSLSRLVKTEKLV